MSAARRLLLAAAGGVGGFAIPVLSRALTSVGDAGYNQQSDYKAVSHGGYTYIAWCDSSGNVECCAVNESTYVASSVVTLHASLGPDLHISPSMVVRDSDHKLLVVYSEHNGAALYTRLSSSSLDSDPTLSGGFAAEQNIDSQVGATAYTYPTVFQQLGKTGDPIFIWFRDLAASVAYVSYTYSTDGGSTWAAKQHLMTVGGLFMYFKVFAGDVRTDLVVSDGHPVDDAPTKLYHLWADATDWHTSSGSVIGGGFPFDPTDGTEVYDGSDGSGWVMNVVTDADEDPAFVFWAGTYGQADMDIRYARWDGAAWDTTTITDEGGDATSYYAPGGAVIDEANPDVVYVAKLDGANFEMFRYTTPDEGATWSAQRLTHDSGSDAMWPAVVRSRSSAIRCIYMRGSITDEDTYSAVIEGLTA